MAAPIARQGVRGQGPSRGALISTTGTVTTGPAGLRWHDIPVSATLAYGQNYDIEIDWTATTTNGFPYWAGIGVVPAVRRVRRPDGRSSVRFGGAPDAHTECVQSPRLAHAAPARSRRPDRHRRRSSAIHDAYPRIRSPEPVDPGLRRWTQAARVSVQVYDVAGRKVADVMKSKSLPAGSGRAQHRCGAARVGGLISSSSSRRRPRACDAQDHHPALAALVGSRRRKAKTGPSQEGPAFHFIRLVERASAR